MGRRRDVYGISYEPECGEWMSRPIRARGRRVCPPTHPRPGVGLVRGTGHSSHRFELQPPAMAPTTRNGSAPARDRVGQRGIRRLMGQVLLAGEEPQERPAPLGDVVADRPAQHRIAGLERVEDRALRGRALDAELHLAVDAAPASADGSGGRLGSWQCLDLDGQHGREVADDGGPAIAGIGRRVHLAAGGAEIHAARIERVDGHRVAQHVDVAVALRQALR